MKKYPWTKVEPAYAIEWIGTHSKSGAIETSEDFLDGCACIVVFGDGAALKIRSEYDEGRSDQTPGMGLQPPEFFICEPTDL